MQARHLRRSSLLVVSAAAVALITLGTGGGASAATVIDGPVNLGTASTYGVLGASAVTNTGPSVINGDLGLSPGTSITGFGGAPNGVVNGTTHQTDAAAAQAQRDTTTAYNVAASLSPTRTGLTELNGLSLSPRRVLRRRPRPGEQRRADPGRQRRTPCGCSRPRRP